MRTAYLDCFSGISGDMFLGALVDAGVSAALFEETVAALNLGARLEISKVVRGGISATKVDVFVAGEKDLPREEFWRKQREENHSHASDHSHPHGHGHSHGRGLEEIRHILQRARISEWARQTAIGIFERLGAVEAAIHNMPVERVHFHEVGAVDALVDIVCGSVGAEALNVGEWVCSALNVGSGTMECAHGTLPVPAPATLRLLEGAPVYSQGPQVELVTPTGAAIVKQLASRFGAFPTMKLERIGYGAGSRELAHHPNVLRITIGESEAQEPNVDFAQETVSVLEANLDDLNPQVLAFAMERLFTEGALDVFSVPIQMKKNRQAALLTVLAKPKDADRLSRVIFAETTTLGVRQRDEQRRVLTRRWETVATEWGPVRIKIANLNGSIANYAPEFEDCRAIALERKIPLKTVMEQAMRAYSQGAKRG